MFKQVASVWFAVAALALLTPLAHASACYNNDEAPKSFRQSVDEAESIVLARIVSGQQSMFAKKGLIDFDFEIVEAIKGDNTDHFRMRGAWIQRGGAKDNGSLGDHHASAFWDRQITRLDSAQNCGQEPKFDPEATYLIFDPNKAQVLSPLSVESEVIDIANDDAWLAAVRELAANPKLEFVRSLTGPEYLKQQRSVALIAIDSCSDKLRGDAHYLAEVKTLFGETMMRDNIDPGILASALEGCDGFTALVGIFYRPTHDSAAAIEMRRIPMQQFTTIDDGQIDIAAFTTQIGILEPSAMSIDTLVASLLPGPDLKGLE